MDGIKFIFIFPSLSFGLVIYLRLLLRTGGCGWDEMQSVCATLFLLFSSYSFAFVSLKYRSLSSSFFFGLGFKSATGIASAINNNRPRVLLKIGETDVVVVSSGRRPLIIGWKQKDGVSHAHLTVVTRLLTLTCSSSLDLLTVNRPSSRITY